MPKSNVCTTITALALAATILISACSAASLAATGLSSNEALESEINQSNIFGNSEYTSIWFDSIKKALFGQQLNSGDVGILCATKNVMKALMVSIDESLNSQVGNQACDAENLKVLEEMEQLEALHPDVPPMLQMIKKRMAAHKA